VGRSREPPGSCTAALAGPSIAVCINLSLTGHGAIEALTNRTAELGLVVNPAVRDTIVSTEIFRDTIVTPVAPNHPLVGSGTVSLDEIAKFPLGLTELSVLSTKADR